MTGVVAKSSDPLERWHMRRTLILEALAVANVLDARVTVTEAAAEAWQKLFDLHVPDLTLEELESAVYAHYGASGDRLMPNKVVELVRRERRLSSSLPTLYDEPAAGGLWGTRVIAEILRRIRKAGGGDPLNDRRIGASQCEFIATEVLDDLGVQADPQPRPGQHCGRSGCLCTHTLGCDAGWIASKSHPGAYRACPNCAPTRSMILSKAHSTREAGALLRDPARVSR